MVLPGIIIIHDSDHVLYFFDAFLQIAELFDAELLNNPLFEGVLFYMLVRLMLGSSYSEQGLADIKWVVVIIIFTGFR